MPETKTNTEWKQIGLSQHFQHSTAYNIISK